MISKKHFNWYKLGTISRPEFFCHVTEEILAHGADATLAQLPADTLDSYRDWLFDVRQLTLTLPPNEPVFIGSNMTSEENARRCQLVVKAIPLVEAWFANRTPSAGREGTRSP